MSNLSCRVGRALARHAERTERTERSGGLAPPMVTRTRPRWRRGIQIPDERVSLGPTPFAPTISSGIRAGAHLYWRGHCLTACAASLTESNEHPGVAFRVFPWVFPSPPDCGENGSNGTASTPDLSTNRALSTLG
jgi:hypothetical protein